MEVKASPKVVKYECAQRQQQQQQQQQTAAATPAAAASVFIFVDCRCAISTCIACLAFFLTDLSFFQSSPVFAI